MSQAPSSWAWSSAVLGLVVFGNQGRLAASPPPFAQRAAATREVSPLGKTCRLHHPSCSALRTCASFRALGGYRPCSQLRTVLGSIPARPASTSWVSPKRSRADRNRAGKPGPPGIRSGPSSAVSLPQCLASGWHSSRSHWETEDGVAPRTAASASWVRLRSRRRCFSRSPGLCGFRG